MKIEKKVWPEYFQAIMDGKKKYELRLADFDCKEGDELVLREWDPKTNAYTGRETTKQVTIVVKTNDIKFWTKEEVEQYGYQVIGIE